MQATVKILIGPNAVNKDDYFDVIKDFNYRGFKLI